MTTAERLRQEGRKLGRQEGAYLTYAKFIRRMKKNNLSKKEIAKISNIDTETIDKILNNQLIEIPLNLLDPNS